jgi:hypothetical protein
VTACISAEIASEIFPFRHRAVCGDILVQDQYYRKEKQTAHHCAAVKQISAEFLTRAVVYGNKSHFLFNLWKKPVEV